jgi:hypothetical protein
LLRCIDQNAHRDVHRFAILPAFTLQMGVGHQQGGAC